MIAVVHNQNSRLPLWMDFEIRKLRLRMIKDDKNFAARTERNFEKLICVDWFSLQVRSNMAL